MNHRPTTRQRAPKKPTDPLADGRQPDDLRQLWEELEQLAPLTLGKPQLQPDNSVIYLETEQSQKAKERSQEIYSQIAELTRQYQEGYKRQLEVYQAKRAEYLDSKRKEAGGTYKMGGHLLGQMVQYDKARSVQLSLDDLEPHTKELLLEANQQGSYKHYRATGELPERLNIAAGINVSSAQYQLIDCLAKLLHDHSGREEQQENYYLGNLPTSGSPNVEYPVYQKPSEMAVKREAPAPRLIFTLNEITQAYIGRNRTSGKLEQDVYETIAELAAKDFLIRYQRTIYKNQDSSKGRNSRHQQKVKAKLEKTVQTVSMYDKLIKILQVEEHDKRNPQKDYTRYVAIQLSPVFIDQISSHFVIMPRDLASRTRIASGEERIRPHTLRLRNYLLRAIANGQQTHRITEANLLVLLDPLQPGQARRVRTQRALEALKHAVKTSTNLGIITKVDISQGYTGTVYVFHLNPEWYKEAEEVAQELGSEGDIMPPSEE